MDWRDRAACLEEDPELFFPIGNTGPAIMQIEEAKAVCRRCPVMDTCLKWAIESGQDAGVWGGMSEDERRALKRRNARARRASSPPRHPPPPRAPPPRGAPAVVRAPSRPMKLRRAEPTLAARTPHAPDPRTVPAQRSQRGPRTPRPHATAVRPGRRSACPRDAAWR